MYAPNKRVSKYMRQKLIELQGEIGKFIIIAGEFKYPSVSKSQIKQEEY